MKPPPFAYHDPQTLDDALDLLSELSWDASLLAGGQSLIPLLNMRLARPSALIDLRRVPGLDVLDEGPEGIRMGAMVRMTALERHAAASKAAPSCLRQAIRAIGHPQIRNRTTVGGNLAHADPASELPAVMVALDGRVGLRSRDGGTREVAAEGFFEGVLATARRPDEVLVEAVLPTYPGRTAFVEVARRPGDFALVGACVGAVVEGPALRDVRISTCGAGDRPRRLGEAEALAQAGEPSPSRLAEVADAVAESVDPPSDLHASAGYRRAVAGVLVRRALEGIVGSTT